MWIKICGIRDVATAARVAELAPSAIGLNFYDQTPRNVSIHVAAEIVSALPDGVEPVGLFVNASVDEVLQTCRECHIQTVQLHGDEPPELLAELCRANDDLKLIRALRVDSDDLEPLADYLERCRQVGVVLHACLIDARVEGLFGGSGTTVSWTLLAEHYQRETWPRLVLAGGLDPDNVAAAIRAVQPWGVDVASGVESSAGVKDLERTKRFIEAAEHAFGQIESESETA